MADVLNSTKRYEIDIEGNKNACVVEISKTFWGGYTYACTYLGEFVECKDAEGGEGGVEFMLEVTNAEFGDDRKCVLYTTRLRDRAEIRSQYGTRTTSLQKMDRKVRSHFRDMGKVKMMPNFPPRSIFRSGTSFHFIQERARNWIFI